MEKNAFKTFLTLFVIGSILLALYFVTMSETAALLGYTYSGVAMLIVIMYLIVLGFKFIQKKISASTLLKCTGILLINLPIAAVYFYFVTILMSTARITFENTTGYDISEVSIGGCTNQELGELKNGQSQTVWFKIKSNCSLVLFYKIDKQPLLETPFPGLTRSNGMIATYQIGSKNKASAE